MKRRNFTRREAILLTIGAAATICISQMRQIAPLAFADEIKDGMRTQYETPMQGNPSAFRYLDIPVVPITQSICPHIGCPHPDAGVYTFYDIEKHPTMLSSPGSQIATAVHSPQEVIRMWKVLLWYGWQGPGYDWELWKDASSGGSYSTPWAAPGNETRLAVALHCALSRYWLGTELDDVAWPVPQFGHSTQRIDALNAMLLTKAATDDPDLDLVKIYMIQAPSGKQEIIFWQWHSRVKVTKSVARYAADDWSFDFKATYTGDSAPAQRTFTLTAQNPTWTSDPIPQGTTYKITELSDTRQWSQTMTNATATIPDSNPKQIVKTNNVSFTNTRNTGYLTLTKNPTV